MQINEETLKELVNKFGIFREGDQDKYDEVAFILFNEQVEWKENTAEDINTFPFKGEVNNHVWKIRINDFPEEPMYTLFIDDKAILTFNDMPESWKYSK